MRGFAIAASLAMVLSAAPSFAQAPAQPPAAPKPAGQPPAAPKPVGQPPAAPPAGQKPAPPPAQPAPAPKPPAPFPQGAKVGYVYLQQIAAQSKEGQAAQSRVTRLTTQRQNEIGDKQKALQSNQQKLQTGGNLLSDSARAQLERDIERQTRDLERLQQDAQADINELTQEVQAEFNKKLFPILEQLSIEKGLHMLFSATDAGLIWAADGLDLTADAVKKLDGAGAAPVKP
jgi:Skp family chaperone for outer membrane proteins